MKKLVVPRQVSNLTVQAVKIPFKIEMDPENYQSFFETLFKRVPWWRFWDRSVDVPEHTANGRVDFYDLEHGHLDNGNIILVPLKARRLWARHGSWRVELSGVTNPIGRWCWSGWGIMDLRIVGSVLEFEVITKFETVITS